jgi:hypothetical protein
VLIQLLQTASSESIAALCAQLDVDKNIGDDCTAPEIEANFAAL